MEIVSIQLDAQRLAKTFWAQWETRSKKLTFHKINPSLIFQHTTKISLNDYTENIQEVNDHQIKEV